MPLLALLFLPLCLQDVPAPTSTLAQARLLRQEARSLILDEARRLEELAQQAVARNDTQSATAIRALIESSTPPDGPTPFRPLPEVHQPAETPPPEALQQAAQAIRKQTSQSLFEVATRALQTGTTRAGIASECLRHTLLRDPDHKEARRLIGFVPLEPAGWATPQAAQNVKAGMVLHPTFGWVPEDWVVHLDQGKLPAPRENGKEVSWIEAAQADALRRDFMRRPWQISTEHFDISTNVPLAQAIAFGRSLEAVHEAFSTHFADLADPAASPLLSRFRQPDLWAQPEQARHRIWYFASRDEYVAYARDKLRRDESFSLGFYLDPRESKRLRQPPRSYFYRDPDQSLSALATLFHEASHQILFETAGPSSYDQNVGQFWVWEGLGTYFESFTPLADGSYELGNRTGPRFQKGYDDILKNRQFVPFSDLSGMSQTRFMADNVVHSNYAQAMVWTLFFMHYDHGMYRDGFLDYVAEAYRGRFRPRGYGLKLPDRLGVEAATLDQQMKQFLGAVSPGVDTQAPAGMP